MRCDEGTTPERLVVKLFGDSVVSRLVAVAVVSGLLTGLTGVLLVREFEARDARAEAEAANLARAQRVAVLLDGRIGAVRDQLSLLATHPEVTSFGDEASTGLAVALRISDDLDRLVLFDRSGAAVSGAASSELMSLDEIAGRSPTETRPTVELRLDRRLPAVEIAVPVEDPPGNTVGTLVGEAPLAILVQEAEARLQGTDTRAFLTAPDGTIIAHREQDRVLERETFGELERLIGEGAVTRGSEEGTVVTAVAPVDALAAWVVVEQPESTALASLRGDLGDIITVFVAVIVAIIGAVVLVGRRMLGPLGPLAEAVNRLERGELATRTGVEGVGEVRTVARGFNRMASALQDRQAELEAAELDARLSEQRLRLLVEGVQDYAILLLDPEGRIRSWNEGARRLFGASAAEATGRRLSSFFDQDESPPDPFEELDERGRGESEGWFRRSEGERFWANAVISRLLDRDGTTYGYAAVVHDLTERRATKQALEEALHREQEAAEELRRTNQVKDEFLAIAAHELQTPLAAILGASSMLEGSQPDERRELREIIETHAEDMRLTVNRFLDFTRLQAGRVRILPVEVRLDRELGEHVDLLSRQLGEHEVEVEVPPVTVSMDRAALRHVVTNLVSNAAKFSAPGTRVRVAAEVVGTTLVLTVEDEGIGIAEEDHEQVFELFRQAGRGRSGSRGTGVGLAIVRRYVELLDGRIALESAPGQGSTFRITLPIQPAELRS